MLERKRLAYGDGVIAKPKKMKSLVFSATFLAVTCSCAPTTNAIPRRDPVVEEARRAPARPPRAGERAPGCFPNIAAVAMERGEKVRESICSGNREFILTDRALHIRTRVMERERFGNAEITLDNYSSRTDMREMIARGIVDWEATETACYFLTRDRRLTVMPNDEMGGSIPEYTLPFETANIPRNRMIFHSGFLFIAPLSGDALVMSFGENPDSRFLSLPPAGGFSVRGNMLFFGIKGNEREIRMDGPSVDDVGLR